MSIEILRYWAGYSIYSERLRQEFLGQREFIATQTKEVEIKVDGRIKGMGNKMNGRFKNVEQRFEETTRGPPRGGLASNIGARLSSIEQIEVSLL